MNQFLHILSYLTIRKEQKMSQRGEEDFEIGEEVKKILNERFPEDQRFQKLLPQDVGIIGQIFREQEKEEIVRHLQNLLENCGKKGVMSFDEKVLIRLKEKVEKNYRERYMAFSLNLIKDELPVILCLYQEAQREVIMTEITKETKQPPEFYSRDISQFGE
jgi:hypothetical protein